MSPTRSSATTGRKAEENAAPAASATVRYVAAMVQHGRIRRGWSQEALALASGMTHQLVSRIENATRVRLTLDEVLSLAMGLQLPPAVLAGWATEDGLLAPPPPETVAPFELPTAPPNPRVLGPRVPPGTTPPRIAGRLYLARDVHALICAREPHTSIPGHPEIRECGGCGCAVARGAFSRTASPPEQGRDQVGKEVRG